ncbi:hypothetical protein [Pseudomonas muyukensis]|uniref:Uncharacterized protein n=1 Tax=Pseudomonas muyukensis TaxID=2842357 RepID=A0ABX8M8D5_9PSED|nr:hypothetical protein [Pseudomonas muyukensis]QXH34992.1 hypothetical protein KSS95_23125 [Pseudomonas muyukensis]
MNTQRRQALIEVAPTNGHTRILQGFCSETQGIVQKTELPANRSQIATCSTIFYVLPPPRNISGPGWSVIAGTGWPNQANTPSSAVDLAGFTS